MVKKTKSQTNDTYCKRTVISRIPLLNVSSFANTAMLPNTAATDPSSIEGANR